MQDLVGSIGVCRNCGKLKTEHSQTAQPSRSTKKRPLTRKRPLDAEESSAATLAPTLPVDEVAPRTSKKARKLGDPQTHAADSAPADAAEDAITPPLKTKQQRQEAAAAPSTVKPAQVVATGKHKHLLVFPSGPPEALVAPATNALVFPSRPDALAAGIVHQDGCGCREGLAGTTQPIKLFASQNYLNTDKSTAYFNSRDEIKGAPAILHRKTGEEDARVLTDGHHRVVWSAFHGVPVPIKNLNLPSPGQPFANLTYQDTPASILKRKRGRAPSDEPLECSKEKCQKAS